ncbi:phthiocerol/phthiodiolone dimycocerosyl transferase family protein [Nocardia brasiliensis]|uniref:phthiocerol/phthiodiolone dimycocerosyl transferase family protein n=1 Tax=Nocardia brasiliensis TaxID=37326 RepID=UPI002454A2F1|nr:condensation domain-containing protein [Nocardia brasiliensis]
MPGTLSRPLSPIERWYWILDQVSPLNVISRVRVHGALDATLLRAAADALAARHPFLRVAIAADADGTDPRFVPTAARIEVRTIAGDDATWTHEVDQVELATGTDWASGPLARVLHIDLGADHDVVLVVSHVIADGTSALRLLQDLVTYAEAAQRDPAPVTSLATFDPPEARLPKKFRGAIGAARSMRVALAEELRMTAARPKRLEAQAAVEPSRRRTRFLRRELNGDELDRLAGTCRAKGVSVHGALSAALAAAIGEQMTPGRAGKLAIGSPVDFRGELQPPVGADEAGAYVCTLPTVLPYGPAVDFWDVAAQTNQDLRERSAASQHFALVAMLGVVTPKSLGHSSKTMKMAEQRGPGNICLSNIGRFDFPGRVGGWTVSGAQFIAGISMSGYYVGTVNSSHGQLFWNFTYIEEIVSEQRAVRIADDALDLLRKAIA